MKKITYIIGLLILASNISAQDISITSSSKNLEKGFEWAKEKARSFVVTGKKGPVNISDVNNVSEMVDYIPSYWAGYPLRTAFYSRDFCHQSAGAHLLGLENENFTMMKAFAASANASRKWYPLWAINFDGSPYLLDYKNDNDFVREVPAAFELVEKAYKLYLWTGDKRYLEDEVLWNYYTKVVTEFITLHDEKMPNGIAEGTGEGNIFKGTATFNEQRDVPLIEAGDGIACQYGAFVAYAEMAKSRGMIELSKEFLKKAEDLKTHFNTDWGIKDTDLYNRGYTTKDKPVAGWGKENSWFMPMKGITDPLSERTDKYLDFISMHLDSKDGIPENIEAISYVPEVFFLYNRNELGWKWMNHILSTIEQEHAQSGLTGKNGNYPEVSYVLISNVVENLAGVSVDASRNYISTASHLPQDIKTLEVENIKMGNSLMTVSHEGHHMSSLNYLKGDKALIWNACFDGAYKYLYVNGEKMSCESLKVMGVNYSICQLKLNPGEKKVVSVK
nr:hypothetical protein [Parabacteroides goldsteinii]